MAGIQSLNSSTKPTLILNFNVWINNYTHPHFVMLELSNDRVDTVHLGQDSIPIGREWMQLGTCCKPSEGPCLYV